MAKTKDNKKAVIANGIVKVIINGKLQNMHYQLKGDIAYYTNENYKIIIEK